MGIFVGVSVGLMVLVGLEDLKSTSDEEKDMLGLVEEVGLPVGRALMKVMGVLIRLTAHLIFGEDDGLQQKEGVERLNNI